MAYNTLFLDRDGVINRQRPYDYVKKPDEFIFLDGVIEALRILSAKFRHIIIVTNQRGIGLGTMSLADLEAVHAMMLHEITKGGGRIDRIYYCAATEIDHPDRKPNIGMAKMAQRDYPDLDLLNSWLVGDSRSDILFANRLHVKAVLVGQKYQQNDLTDLKIDMKCRDLLTFALSI